MNIEHLIHANVTRLTDGKLQISWELNNSTDEIAIYWSSSLEVESKRVFLTSVKNERSITVNDPNPNARTYFFLVTPRSPLTVISERRLPITGATNFRDLGGYRTKDGRTIKWNLLYRSDALAYLTPEDHQYLESISLKTIIDFRAHGKAKKTPNQAINGSTYFNIPAFDNLQEDYQNVTDLMKQNLGKMSLSDPEEIMKKLNYDMVEANPAFKQMFTLIQSPENLPIVQHCTAGKDRTGLGSALLLLTLGVPEETVIEDYLLTSHYSQKVHEKMSTEFAPLLQNEQFKHAMQVILGVQIEFLQSAFQSIQDKYGSFENYIEVEYKIDEDKRRELQEFFLV